MIARGNAVRLSTVAMLVLVCRATAIGAERSPIQIEVMGEFAAFTKSLHPDNRIGYRFHEHTPLLFGAVPESADPTESVNASRTITIQAVS